MYTELNRRNQIDICASPCQGLTGTVQDNRASGVEAGIMQDFKKIDRAQHAERDFLTTFSETLAVFFGSSLHPNILG
jgi:hypothetical protein